MNTEKEDLLTRDGIAYLVARLLDNAFQAKKDRDNDKDSLFEEGRVEAYYEMLDTLKNELIIRDEDLKKYGLDIALEAALG